MSRTSCHPPPSFVAPAVSLELGVRRYGGGSEQTSRRWVSLLARYGLFKRFLPLVEAGKAPVMGTALVAVVALVR